MELRKQAEVLVIDKISEQREIGMKSIQAKKQIFKTAKYKNRWKVILFIIWTGIFILSSCIIVKGSSMLGEEFQQKYEKYMENVMKNISEGLLKMGSPLFDYGSGEITKNIENQGWTLGNHWSLASYLEEVSTESIMVDGKGTENQQEIVFLQQELLQKDFPFLAAEGYWEDETTEHVEDEATEAVMASASNKIKQLKESLSTDFLLKNFYIVDSTTSADPSMFEVKKLLERDMTMEKSDEPQILIYHTHGATEGFNSDSTGKEVSIIEVGERLAEILEEDYGYYVIHDETPYDIVNGKVDRNKAYNQSLPGIQAILKKYPSIEVIIDLHRDGIGNEDRRTTVIHGKTTAKFMFFNGISRNKEGTIDYLNNPNLEGNLAFSLQLKLKAMELYPTLTRPNYLKGYRYNLHLREKSLLIELGNQNNSFKEAMNALEPLAEVLDAVLMGE